MWVWCLVSGLFIMFCASLCYVSLQVNKIRSIFQIWVGDECEMFGFVMWILMGSVRGWFLILLKWWNAWFYWEKIGICKEIFGYFMKIFWENFVIFDQVRLKPYFIRVEGIFGWNWVIFSVVGMAKNIDFSRFCRTRYRTQNGGWGMETSDMPFLASGCRTENVNHAPLDW